MIRSSANILLIVLGWTSLIIGIIGIFLPVLPTTPWIILAAYFFSKGSRKTHNWLMGIPYFGVMIKEWEEKGAIRTRAKVWSTAMMIILFSTSLIFFPVNIFLQTAIVLTGLCVVTFILTRPST